MYKRQDQSRPLHNDKKRNKLRYTALITKNPDLHETILKALDNEKEDRKRASWVNEFRPCWKMMSSYINQEAWTMYEDMQFDTPTNTNESNYGEDLI